VVETLVPAAAQAGGDVAEVSTADAMFAGILEIIDLDAPDLPSNEELCWSGCWPIQWSRGSRPLSQPHPWPRPRLKRWSPPMKSPRWAQTLRDS
jgi:hypothetical protein